MDYFVVLTVAKPVSNGFAQNTVARVVKVRPGTTRGELYDWAFNQMPAEMRGGNTLCFSAEPNVLGGHQ